MKEIETQKAKKINFLLQMECCISLNDVYVSTSHNKTNKTLPRSKSALEKAFGKTTLFWTIYKEAC